LDCTAAHANLGLQNKPQHHLSGTLASEVPHGLGCLSGPGPVGRFGPICLPGPTVPTGSGTWCRGKPVPCGGAQNGPKAAIRASGPLEDASRVAGIFLIPYFVQVGVRARLRVRGSPS